MNARQPSDQTVPGDEAVDQLVRQYVDRQVQRADATRLIARVGATRRQAEASVRRRPADRSAVGKRTSTPWLQALSWAAVTVVAATIAFVGGRHLGPDVASAAGVLRDVQSMHAQPVDHCYRVQFAPDPRYWDGQNALEGPSTSVLWTRGDRFWSDCTIGSLHLTLGREADGTLWLSPSPDKGFRFTNDPSQWPAEVALICAINSMSVPQLVQDVLADFDLHTDPTAAPSRGAKTLVWARLKAGRTHPLLSDALLEIDPETNVLTRLVLWTVRDGRPKGTVTYTLLESTTHGDQQYRLQSHLNADAVIQPQALLAPAAAESNGK